MEQEKKGKGRLKTIGIVLGIIVGLGVLFPRMVASVFFIVYLLIDSVTVGLHPCPTSPIPARTDIDLSLVATSLLESDPCGPPCWQGLTPGVSTQREVLDTLHDLPFATNMHQSRVDEYTSIDWQGDASILGYTWYGDIRLFDDTVYLIQFDVAYPLMLQQVLDTIGEPDYVLLDPLMGIEYAVPPCSYTTFIWLDDGFSVELDGLIDHRGYQPSDGAALANSQVRQVRYFQPEADLASYLDNQYEDTFYRNPQVKYYQPYSGLDHIEIPED